VANFYKKCYNALMSGEKIEFLIGAKAYEVVQRFPEIFAQFVQNEVKSVYEGGDDSCKEVIKEETAKGILDVKNLSEKGDFAVAMIKGTPVSMVGLHLGGRLVDGRNVYSVRMAYTDPDFRGKSIYHRLRAFLLEKMNEKYRNPVLETSTLNPTVVKLLQELGWKEQSMKEYSEMRSRAKEDGVEPWDSETESGGIEWRAFLYDPEELANPLI
jgi:GNAT superfamily N-acetyltransferase